jgi:alkylation response protein AidB-like acyl-CoA dehydrogenase
MTVTSASDLDVLGEVTEWLEANWDPELPLREWWHRLGESGWAQAHWPREWYGRGLTRADGLAVSAAIQRFGAVPVRPGSRPGWRAPPCSSTAQTPRSGGDRDMPFKDLPKN